MKIGPARRIAFDVLRRVETQDAYAADLLHAFLESAEQAKAGLKAEDAALATELTLGTLRLQRLLDALLEHQMGQPMARLDPEVRIALRLGVYQLRMLGRVPAHAVVNDSVELVKRARKRSAAGLVNAVLRRAATRQAGTAGGMVVLEGQAEAASPVKGASHSDELAICFSHPTWLASRWIERYGELRAINLMMANNHAPRATCILHDEAYREEAAASLREAGLVVEPSAFLRNAWTVRGGNPGATTAFRHGRISILDEASQMAALLLDVRPGQNVLDLCAAPGGKTATLARAASPNALVVAGDVHVHRLKALRENLERLGQPISGAVVLDATTWLPFSRLFDRILVDAPCSGTGTLARNPEIRWRLRVEDLAELHARQVALLRNALPCLLPGGRLVYATCSLEPEENEQVVEEVLSQSRGVHLACGQESLAGHVHSGAKIDALFDAKGYFRTFPPEHGTDGFFAAVLERSG